MQLELNDEEARELSIALGEHLHSLRAELAVADARQFKARLLETLNLLEGVAARLARTEAGAGVSPI